MAVVGVALVGMALAGCSGEVQGPVAVRVGGVSINAAAVNHWARLIRHGSTVGTSFGKQSGMPRERALDFLISARWLIGEAAEQGIPVSDSAVERALKQRMESVPEGRPEFERELASTGQNVEDVKLEIKAEIAEHELHELVLSRMPVVTSAQGIIDYYHRHISHFQVPEKRLVDLIESIHSRAAAIALGRRLGPGAGFAKRAIQESVARETPVEAANAGNAQLVHAIFAATPGKVAPPAPFNNQWVLVDVRGTTPGRTKGLKEVEAGIQKRFLVEARHKLFAEFTAGLRAKWTAMTDCRSAFVVQRCRQYRGALKLEEDPLVGE
jgi:hypothetical protein